MPQMAPLLWLYLFFFFLITLLLFMMMNFFIKPFDTISSSISTSSTIQKSWKL